MRCGPRFRRQQQHCPAVEAGGDEGVVAAHIQRAHPTVGLRQRNVRRAACQVPQQNTPVIAAADNPAAIRGKSGANDWPNVAGQQVELEAAFRVPQAQTLVGAAGEDSAPVRAKGHCVHDIRMAVSRQRLQPPYIVHGVDGLLQGSIGIGGDKAVRIPGRGHGSLRQQQRQRCIIGGLGQHLVHIVCQFIGFAAACIGFGQPLLFLRQPQVGFSLDARRFRSILLALGDLRAGDSGRFSLDGRRPLLLRLGGGGFGSLTLLLCFAGVRLRRIAKLNGGNGQRHDRCQGSQAGPLQKPVPTPRLCSLPPADSQQRLFVIGQQPHAALSNFDGLEVVGIERRRLRLLHGHPIADTVFQNAARALARLH